MNIYKRIFILIFSFPTPPRVIIIFNYFFLQRKSGASD